MGYKIKRKLVWINNVRLPSEYQEVEYIQSSGTQYIDTGVQASTNIGFDVDFNILDAVSTTGHVVIGTRYSGANNEICVSTYNYNSWGTGVVAYGSQLVNPGLVPGTRQKCSLKNCVFTGCSGTTTSLTPYTFTYTVNLFVFGMWELINNTVVDKSSTKLYSLKLYDGNTLVRDYVPCYSKADGEIGLYDLVNDQFYTNAGTGTFTKGSNTPDAYERLVYPTRRPNANTIAYFPFKEDYLDKVGSRSLTINDCAVGNGVMNINSQASYMLLSSTIGGSQITGSVWYYYGALSTGGGWNTLFAKNGGTYNHILMPATTSGGTVGNIGFYNSGWYPSSKVLELGKWYHIVFVKNGTNQKIYVNAELVLDSNSSFDNNSQPLGIISSYNTSNGNQGAQGKMSELFFEDRLWSSDDVSNYYNQTKWNYPN